MSDKDHTHSGIDTPKIRFDDLFRKRLIIRHSLLGTLPQTSTNYGIIFIAPFPCIVEAVREVHGTAGTAGGAVVLGVERLTGTTASASGSAMLSTNFNLKATANTVQEGTMTSTISSLRLLENDRLGVYTSGTLTSLTDVVVTIELRY